MARAGFAVVTAAMALAVTTTAQQQGTYQMAAQTVAVYATVLDRDGHLVPNLTKRDFQIFDNGQPAEITVFSNDRQLLTVALMLDMSESMQSRLNLVKDSTRRFIDALQPGDRLRLGTFAEEVALSPLLTDDKAVLNRILDEELWPGGTTPLWTALNEAMASFKGETSRRIVMSLTDGTNTAGAVAFDQVRRRAIEDVAMIYVVGMEGTTLGNQVVRLADDTGGGHFEVKKGTTLTATFARVADELRHQYALGFKPIALDGEVHTIEVRLSRPGLSARARKNYLATPNR
jgi:Ca-activated chloride channel family protein